VSLGKGIAIGFVAGLAVAGGAFLVLRDDTAAEREAARIAELDAHIQRLDQTVATLSERVAMERASYPAAVVTARTASPPAVAETDHASEIAEADAMVDLGLQSGHWTRQQQDDLGVAIADLDVAEQGRIKARIAKAINDGQLKFDPRR
jgi:hypothetical protein